MRPCHRTEPQICDGIRYAWPSPSKRGEHARAIDDFNRAIELNPSSTNAFYGRAFSYDSKAINARDCGLRQGHSARSRVSRAWNSRCWARAIIGELEGSKIAISAADAAPYSRRWTARSGLSENGKSGRSDRGLHLRAGVRKKNAGSLYGRGIANAKKGNEKAGRVDIKPQRPSTRILKEPSSDMA